MTGKSTLSMHLAAVVACMLPVAAHALSEDPLDMIYEAPSVSASRDALGNVALPLTTKPCAVSLQLKDIRPSKATLGANIFMLSQAGGTPLMVQSIRGGDGLPWLRGAISSLQTQQIRLAESANAHEPSVAQLGIEVQLLLAHAWPEGMNLASTVVLSTQYRAPTGDVHRTYVGQGMKANWANGNGEFMGVLNAAMTDAMTALAQDVGSLCEGRALAASLP